LDVFSADYCCLLLVDSFRQHLVVKACNAPELIDRSFNIQYGFAGMMLRTREPVIISDYDPEQHVDSELMVMTRGRSLIGATFMAGSEPTGAIVLVHGQPGYFSYGQFKLLRMLAANIGLRVSSSYLDAEIRAMVSTDQLTGL